MELKDEGTETQIINNNVSNKPRPPPQILKPKPSLPKKPAIPAKPETPPVPITKHSVKEKSAPITSNGSPKASPPRTSTSRPKEPPPPLPRVAPKGSVVQKTPPTLPKTPPRTSLKNKKLSEGKHSENDVRINGDDETIHGSKNSVVDVEPEQKDAAKIEAENEIPAVDCDTMHGNNSEDNVCEDFTFSNLKSRFISSNSAPKVPEKPKPPNKPKASIDASKADDIIEPDNNLNDVNDEAGIHFLKGHGKSTGDSTVWFNKSSGSPKHSPVSSHKNSPVLPRNPPPRVSAKPKSVAVFGAVVVDDDVKSESSSSSASSSPEKLSKHIQQGNTFRAVNDRDQENVVGNDDIAKNESVDVNVCTDKPKPKGSPKPLPKPVPRKPVPSARPRPTPRKRLSINRLSGSDETFDRLAASDNISKDSNENVSFDQSKAIDVESEEEVKYRMIEKHARSQSHITELQTDASHRDESVILRKKIVREDNVDEGEELTVEELQSISHLLEGSDDENHDDDKFMKKIEHPVNFDSPCQIPNIKSDLTEKNNVGDKSLKKSYEDLLDDKSILEPSSLLNEIEDILTRSFKHSSLTRSGSSPEKKSSPYLNGAEIGKTARSYSVDVQPTETPIRPPRPKKEQKRLRSMSHNLYDSCGSDTESLPDLSRSKDEISSSGNTSLTLGKAKPHPPKPKRNKLLRVQRSHSDITAMKSVVEKMEGSDSKSSEKSEGKKSPYKTRPSRKAPEPPNRTKGGTIQSSSRNSLDTVVPLDVRVKSMSLDSKGAAQRSKGDCTSGGAFYHSINDDVGSSDGEHDYQDISDDNDKMSKHKTRPVQGLVMKISKHMGKKSVSPPKLPPRNLNNSHSFDNSSLSSAGHDFDSVITSVASSTEDMSISSGCFEQDICSPRTKNPLIFKSVFPKTSSPYVKGQGQTVSDENLHRLAPSNSSLSDGMGSGKLRPVSGCSVQSDSWSGSAGPEHSSSDSELDEEARISRKKEKKLFMIAKEIASSEQVFVDVLKLLNVDFRLHITSATEKLSRPIIPNETLNRILDYLPQLELFNEGLLKDLEERISEWEEKKCIADIFVKKGPFLKLYSSYIRDFETITSTLDEALKKYPQFATAVKEFEMSPRCASLALKHYMLKPIQRIPQYRLLLQDYMKNLPPDCVEMKDMQTALAIVSEVAHHANENMRREDYVQKMLEIQRSLIGQFEVIKPGRLFLKEGELKKLSRKEMQPRYFFLFNDVLLYTTPVATGYRLNNVLPLAGMKVSVAAQDEYKMEFSIISVQRSFTLHGATIEERDDWVTALNAAIEENALKRNTFEAVRAGAQGFEALLDKDFVLGHKAPLWIPDARVTMCMLCTCEFTVTWRRHHCRACGWVVCGNCSEGKAPLRYLKYKLARVCDKCFNTLSAEAEKKSKEQADSEEGAGKDEDDGGNTLSLNGLFERFQKIRRSGRSEKKNSVRPDRLKEVSATDQNASMSGYLQKWQKGKKWKKKRWYLVLNKVLYTFKASQDTAAASSMVLLGYEVSRFSDYFEGVEPDLLFQLSHANTEPVVFRTDSATATEKWVTVMRESTVA